MNAKSAGPKRGEIGLATFHHGIGISSFLAGIVLMLVSFTALHWFGGVIGLPEIARIGVAIAFEVLAAGLASSATTARRESGETDTSAWIAFGAVVSVNAFANVMHVIVFLVHAKPGTPAADLPPELRGSTWFIAAACVFAAICALGGTLGVHRFGWLRAHGADADWTDTAEGVVVQQPARKPAPKPAARVEERPARRPEPATVPAAPTARVEEPAVRVEATPAGDRLRKSPEQVLVDSICDEMLAEMPEDDKRKPDAAEARRRAGFAIGDKPVQATVRGWVKAHYEQFESTRAQDDDARVPEPMPVRAEVRLADPAVHDLEDHGSARHAAERVAS